MIMMIFITITIIIEGIRGMTFKGTKTLRCKRPFGIHTLVHENEIMRAMLCTNIHYTGSDNAEFVTQHHAFGVGSWWGSYRGPGRAWDDS